MVEQEFLRPEPQPLAANETAGKMLSCARVAWDLSVEDVASNLNLSEDTINALERDDYDQLPGYTFVKGYIRSYANLLKLDPAEVINLVELKPERPSEIPTSKGSLKLKSRTQGKRKKSGGLFFKSLLVILLIAALSLFGMNQLSKLDMDELATFFKLPNSGTAEKSGDSNDEFMLPVTGNSENDSGNQSEGKKEALIRIE
jgi:cytoskeletal protein RodZ